MSVAALISMPCCIWAAYSGWSYWALVIQTAVSTVCNLILLWTFSPWKPRLIFSLTSFKEFFAFGSRLVLNGIVDVIYSNAKSLLIGKYYGAADLGTFNRAYQTSEAPNKLVNGILGSVTFPILSTIQHDEIRLIEVYRKYIRITSLGIFFGGCLLFSLSEPLVALVYGPQWMICVPYMQILIWGIMGFHFGSINNNLRLVKGRSDLLLRLTLIKKGVSFALLIPALDIIKEKGVVEKARNIFRFKKA